MPESSFDMFQRSWTVYWWHSLGMMVMHGRREMTEMVTLHHLFRRWHLVWRRVRIHGNRMIARKMVDEMAGYTTIGARVMHWRCRCHCYGWRCSRLYSFEPSCTKEEESTKYEEIKKGKETKKKRKQDETIEREDPSPIYGSTVWKGLTFRPWS